MRRVITVSTVGTPPRTEAAWRAMTELLCVQLDRLDAQQLAVAVDWPARVPEMETVQVAAGAR